MDEEKQRLEALRKRLDQEHSWPSVYMFKFVLTTDEQKLARIHEIFGESAEFRSRLSSNGKYTSVTVRAMMLDADGIFDRYREVSSLGGIISL
jgi:putative lipoic acid-binding regulatory protein